MFVRSFLSTVFLASMLIIVGLFVRSGEVTATEWIIMLACLVAMLLFRVFVIKPMCNAIAAVRRWYSTVVFVPSLILTLCAVYLLSSPGAGALLLTIAGILGLAVADELRSVYDRQKVKVTKE